MLLALAFAAVVAAVLAQTMTRRLRRLTRASADFAKGYAPFELTVRGRDEIGELGRAVQSMAAELERRNRYNREFVSILLHELKTPLTSIKGASELLEGTASDKPDARQKFLANIRFEAERMIRMVGELAELTRLDTDTAPARRVRADYPALVREIVERLEPGLDPGHAPISVAVPEKPIHVRAAPDRIEQLLANLLDNAIRHTPPDGAIQVTVEEGPAGCVITRVKDTGCGIPAANLAKVFDPFFTTVPRDKPLDYGSGLGLAIARSIVENHHGRLSVESEPGHGATFIVTLPLDSG
jgi:two-component system sensor histidine kinase ChvG